MHMRVLCLIVLAIFLSPTAAHSHASITTTNRYLTVACSGSNYDLHWAHPGSVPVYVNTSGVRGVQHLKRPNASYWTVTDIIEMVRVGIVEFNNSSSVGLRLYYAGATSSTDILGAIVVNSAPEPLAANGSAYTTPTCVGAFRGRITKATIYFNRINSSGGDRTFSGLNEAAGTGIDILGLFNHELGHALGMGHSDGALVYDSGGHSYDPTTAIMFAFAILNGRHWTKYDRDTLLGVYGYRYGTYLPFQSGHWKGFGNSWNVGLPSGPQTTLARGGGKISELSTRAVFGWMDSNAPELRTVNRLSPDSYYNFVAHRARSVRRRHPRSRSAMISFEPIGWSEILV